MKRSKRLRSIARHVSDTEARAARAFATDLMRVERARTRIAQLEIYRDEYGRQQGELAHGAVAMARLKNLNGFVLDLDRAIAIASGQLEQALGACESRRQRWREARAHAQAVDHLVAKCRAMENRLTLGRDQSEQDEHAQRERGREYEYEEEV